MQNKRIQVQIQICSNCESHKWYTRHNQDQYANLANQFVSLIKSRDPSIQTVIHQVGQTKVGSFQILCNTRVVFSKLKLGYMPDLIAVSDKLFSYISDLRDEKSTKKYSSNLRTPSPRKQRIRSANNHNDRQKQKSNKHGKSNQKTIHRAILCKNNNQNKEKKNRRDEARQQIKRRRFQLIQQFKNKYPNHEINMGVVTNHCPMTSNNEGRTNNKPSYNRDQAKGYENYTESFKLKIKSHNSELDNISFTESKPYPQSPSPQKTQTKQLGIIVGGQSEKNQQANQVQAPKQTLNNPQQTKAP